MPTLIAAVPQVPLPARLSIEVGDLLLLPGSGVRVVESLPVQGVIEVIGAFCRGVIGTDGNVHAPAGMPDAVAIMARGPGQVRIELVSGGLGRARESRPVEIIVRAWTT